MHRLVTRGAPAALWLIATVFAEPPCRVVMAESVEVRSEVFSLADLLPATGCAQLSPYASQVVLGKIPREGGVRVLDGANVLALLSQLAHREENNGSVSFDVPPRISVRRWGSGLSCSEIADRIFTRSDAVGRSNSAECAVPGLIPRDASLELVRRFWDPALGNWNLIARCAHASDCIPFLLRLPESSQSPKLVPSGSARLDAARPGSANPAEPPLVRAGQRATLVWDQAGIRAVLPAVSLDAGRAGARIRVRLVSGGRIVHATVMDAEP